MVAASSILRESSYPETLIHTGSPKGALKLKRTGTPGKHPISINLTDRYSSVKPAIIPTSPGFISDTFLGFSTITLFRLILNKAKIWVVPVQCNDLRQYSVFFRSLNRRSLWRRKNQKKPGLN